MKTQIFVMPAWIAGIQVRKDAFGDIRVAWIPTVHAGMTHVRGLWQWSLSFSKGGNER
jgi:hypothetical protein